MVGRGNGVKQRRSFGATSTRAEGRGYGSLRGVLPAAFLGLLLLGGLAWAAVAGTVPPARHPTVFGGSLVLEDQRPLTVIDLATGRVTIRLQGIYTQVGASGYGDVEALALDDGTLLMDRKTGTFNILGQDDYLVDSAGPGVGLGNLSNATGAGAFAAGSSAYIVRYAPKSTVSLVDASTVRAGARLEASVTSATPRRSTSVAPRGFASLSGPVADAPGSAVVDPATGDLWLLEGSGQRCVLADVHPTPTSGTGLSTTRRGSFPVPCERAAIEESHGSVAVSMPGVLYLFAPGGPSAGTKVHLNGTAGESRYLPVQGATQGFRFLVHTAGGWSLVGVSSKAAALGPLPLRRLAAGADPAVPAMSRGSIYTLDQTSVSSPTLWQIDASTGAMSPVEGAKAYPTRGPTEKPSFEGAQILAAGPRVVFNNPGSLLAVVAFTDGSQPPVVVDKSEAVTLSASGPADLDLAPPSSEQGPQAPVPAGTRAVPSVQPVSQQVTCATTTQKPYAPQITSVTPSSGSAIVAWSYELLDQSDCEPDTWTVRIVALDGAHQPDVPVQTVNGQNQLLFAGLRPATTYEATVTAYINKQSTPSVPVTFTTAARGPDAPISVVTSSDGKGDWVVSWTPCTAADCYVPADTWNVIATGCAGSYVGQPPVIQVPGNQDSVTIDSDTLGLLGESLSFSIEGRLASGLAGNPTSDGACTQAWRPPDPSVISLGRTAVQSGETVDVTLQVATSVPSVEAFGSRSTEFVYSVGDVTVGPTTATAASFPGLAPGVPYKPSVEVVPVGHEGSAITVYGDPVTPTLAWPPDLAVTAAPTVDQSNPDVGSVVLSFQDLPPGPMETKGTYTCGSTQGPAFGGPLSAGTFTVAMDLVKFGGSCSATVTVSDSDTAPYGGTSSLPLKGQFSIGNQPTYSFSSQIPQGCQQALCVPQQIDVLYTGATATAIDKGGDWAISTASSQPAGGGNGSGTDPCTSTDQLSAPTFPVTIDLPDLCLDPKKVDVKVSYLYLGATTSDDAGTPSGTPAPPPSTTTSTSTPTSSTTGTGSTGTGTGSTGTGTGSTGTGTTGAGTTPNRGLAASAVPALVVGAGFVRRRSKTRATKKIGAHR